jgi:uncharacterized protein
LIIFSKLNFSRLIPISKLDLSQHFYRLIFRQFPDPYPDHFSGQRYPRESLLINLSARFMPEQLQARYTCTWHSHIREIPAPAWDALAQPLKTPFLEWAWLNNLEASGSATPSEGWLPHHLAVWQGSTLVAAAALYIKGHSYGEFVFDQQWADLAHRLGVKYYPKLLGMTPFTPAEGYRFLIAEGEDESALTELMLSEIDHFCVQHRLSGCSFLFVDPGWRPVMEGLGCRTWLHHSYIWQNQSFANFDGYLGSFNANQRRNIKRERKAVTQAGLEMRTLQGREIPAHLFPLIYHFYSDTCDKFWGGSKYLTSKFFKELHHCYPERVLLVGAFPEGNDHHPLAMAFCIHKGERLYGRYWGVIGKLTASILKPVTMHRLNGVLPTIFKFLTPVLGGVTNNAGGFRLPPITVCTDFMNPNSARFLMAISMKSIAKSSPRFRRSTKIYRLSWSIEMRMDKFEDLCRQNFSGCHNVRSNNCSNCSVVWSCGGLFCQAIRTPEMNFSTF